MMWLRFMTLAHLSGVINSGNILILHGLASPSHHLWNRALADGLAIRGHNITIASVDEDKNPHPNIHYVYMESAYNMSYSGNASAILFEQSNQALAQVILGAYNFCEACCDGILKSEGLDLVLNYPNDFRFDAVIYDFTCGFCLLPLLHKFNYPPLVSVSPFNNPPYTHHLTGDQKYPALVPHYATNFPRLMNLPQRVCNFLLYLVESM